MLEHTSIPTRLTSAGKYPVIWSPCPDFASELVDLEAPRTGVLHTTEGGWTGSMAVFKTHFAPHFIVGLNSQKKAEIAQLVPVGTIGAACKAHNDHAMVQVEVVGFSKETPWIFDDATLDALASLMLTCSRTWGIPLFHPWTDGDYGRAGDNPHRHAGKYGVVAGWFGHGDMPSPDTHWDPGALQWSKIFDHAKALDVASAGAR